MALCVCCCCIQTVFEYLMYYRIIKDGSGSVSVFNGPTPLYDALYTKANNFIAGRLYK